MGAVDQGATEDRPAGACLTCRPPAEGRAWRRADSGYRTCSGSVDKPGCADRLHHWLSLIAVDDDGRPDSIPALYAVLNPRPGATADSSGIRRPAFGPRSPANDHIVAMRDSRTVHLRPGDPCSAPAVLRSWVLYVWDERYDDAALNRPDYQHRRRALPAIVSDMAVWLDRNIDWLTRHEIVVDLFTELRTLHSQLRSIGSRRYKVGECPETIDEGEHTRECGAALFAPLHGDEIRCFACGRSWPRSEWFRLGNLLDSV